MQIEDIIEFVRSTHRVYGVKRKTFVPGTSQNVTLERMKSIKVGRVDRSPVVESYYKALLPVLEKNPHVFKRSS